MRHEASQDGVELRWLAWALTGGGVFLTAYGGIELTRGSGQIAAIWPANAFFLVCLLTMPRAGLAAMSAAAFVGYAAANLLARDPAFISLGLPFINLVEVLICLWGLRWAGDHNLTRPRTLVAFCAIGVGPASIASSLLAGTLFKITGIGPFGDLFLTWYGADALGLITFTPLFASIAGRALKRRKYSRERVRKALLCSVGFALLLAGIFFQSSYPLLFLIYPALVGVAFLFGFFGASIALVVTAVVALVATGHGHGPLSLIHGSLREQITILQIFVAVSAAMSLAVAATLAERERLTEQLRFAKETAEAAEDRLRDSEGRYRLLAEHTSDVIVLRSAKQTTEYVSPSIGSLLGYAAEQFVALDIRSLVHPDDRARVRVAIDGLSAARPHATNVHRMRRENGEWIWVEVAFTHVSDDPSSPRILAVVRDVTERRAHEEQLEAARSAAEEALKVKSEFLAMMSHELRTPLNGIIGFSDLIIEGGELKSPEGLRYVRNVQSASRTLLSIVNDVMDVSKLEAGAIELDPQPFSLRDLFDETAAMVRIGADANNLALIVDVDESIPATLIGDDARIRQVLLNLLSNAVKFTPSGSVTLRATLDDEADRKARVKFVVADTGIGIPEDKRHRLFKRFSQIDQTTSRRYGGAGLGLSITKNLLDLMGGSIAVRSAEGVGSEFEFDLTLGVARSAEQDLQPKAAKPAAVKKRSILVAEDVQLNRELLSALLAKWGYEVDLVENGERAVEAVADKRYDVILMDVQMPEMDGLEATRRIRAMDGPRRNTPIIALTANVLPDEVVRFAAAGMGGHVGKPFVPDQLKAAIESHAGRSPDGEAEVFDQAVLDELTELVGAGSVATFLKRLDTQIAAAFSKPPRADDDLRELRYQAHSLASTSGMLGFMRLSAACVALETEIDKQGSSVATILGAFADALTAKDQSLLIIDELGDRPEIRAAAS